jgi:hypothetical protein
MKLRSLQTRCHGRSSCRSWRNQIFRRNDLPLAIAFDPYICPDEAAASLSCRISLHPGFAALSNSSLPEETNRHAVQMIRYKRSRAVACIRYRLGLVHPSSIRIDPHKIVGQNSLKHGTIIRGDRLCPLSFTHLDVLSIALALPITACRERDQNDQSQIENRPWVCLRTTKVSGFHNAKSRPALR